MRRSVAAERQGGAAPGDDEEVVLPEGEPVTCAGLLRIFDRRNPARLSLVGKLLIDAPIQQCLARCLTTSQRLCSLSLERSSCGNHGIGFLVEALLSAGACPLQSLRVRQMGLTADAGPALGRLLARSRTLTTLDASHNDLQAEGVMLLVEPLLSNPQVVLELLDLGHNNVTQVNFPILEAVLTMHQRLQISLLGNPIKASASRKAPAPAAAPEHPPVLSCRSPRAEDLHSGVLVKPATQRLPTSPQMRSPSTSPPAKFSGEGGPGASSSELSSNGRGSPSAEALTSPSTPRTPPRNADPTASASPGTPPRVVEGAVPKVGWRVLNMAAVAKLPSPGVDHPQRSRSAPSRAVVDRHGSPSTQPVPFPVIQQVPTVSLGAPPTSPLTGNDSAEATRAQLAAQAALIQRLEAERDSLKRDLTQTAASLRSITVERDTLRTQRQAFASLDKKLELLRGRDAGLADLLRRELHTRLDHALAGGHTTVLKDEATHPVIEPYAVEKPVQVLAAYRLSPRQMGRAPPVAVAAAQTSPRRGPGPDPLEWPRSPPLRRPEEPAAPPAVATAAAAAAPHSGGHPTVAPGADLPPRPGPGPDRRASTGSTVRRRQVAPPVTASSGRPTAVVTTTREGLLGGAPEGWRSAAGSGPPPSVRYRAVGVAGGVARPNPTAYLHMPSRKAQSLPSTGSGTAGAGTTIVGVRRVEHVAPRRAVAPDSRHPSPRIVQRNGPLP